MHLLKVILLTCMHSTQLIRHDFTWPLLTGNQILALLIWTIYRATLSTTAASSCCHRCIDSHWSTNENSSIQGPRCVEFLKHFTGLSWLILRCFLRLFFMAFLLRWTVTAGSDSRDGTEGRDDMQQRSRGEDMSRTSTNCQYVPSMLISMLKLADISHFLWNFVLISILFSGSLPASLTCNLLCFFSKQSAMETREGSFTFYWGDNNNNYKSK